MSQHIEIEFKNLLTKEEFDRIIAYFQIDSSKFKKQVNHYFDTPSFSLKDIGCALRIRQKENHYEMTLKQPVENGLLETNQDLLYEEAEHVIKTGNIGEGSVLNQIRKLHVPYDRLTYFGSLTTERAEIDYKDGLLVVDYSYYLNKDDYELEYEVNNYEKGKIEFYNLLNTLNIPLRETDNKIRRFYEEKYKDLD